VLAAIRRLGRSTLWKYGVPVRYAPPGMRSLGREPRFERGTPNAGRPCGVILRQDHYVRSRRRRVLRRADLNKITRNVRAAYAASVGCQNTNSNVSPSEADDVGGGVCG
jgi:hypothetical protein